MLLDRAKKNLLTLSVTQVACERSFFILKLVKNRLRTSIKQEHLEAFMSTEREILVGFDIDNIIDKVAESSKVLRNLLTF